MNKEEIIKILQGFGLSEDEADYYATLEVKDNLAWLAAFRFVRPLNNNLEFYKNRYGDMLRDRIERGLNNKEVEMELLKQGATSKLLGQFAYEIALSAYNDVLYRLADPTGADFDLENEGEDLPSWRLVVPLTHALIQSLFAFLLLVPYISSPNP